MIISTIILSCNQATLMRVHFSKSQFCHIILRAVVHVDHSIMWISWINQMYITLLYWKFTLRKFSFNRTEKNDQHKLFCLAWFISTKYKKWSRIQLDLFHYLYVFQNIPVHVSKSRKCDAFHFYLNILVNRIHSWICSRQCTVQCPISFLYINSFLSENKMYVFSQQTISMVILILFIVDR